jgi:dienelactone hydrolase
VTNSKMVQSVRPAFPGYLYVPATPGPHPGILLLHGSEGGNGDFWTMPGEPPPPTGEQGYVAKMARHFASLGFATYAYSYFHAEVTGGYQHSAPKELANVDLNETARALAWFKRSPHVQGLSVGLWGGSRGAEHALILASLLSVSDVLPDAIIADAPSDFVYPGFSLEAAQAISSGGPFPETFPAAWRIGDKPIEMYSAIEIEKIQAPMLIIYGAEDPVWGPHVNVFKLHERLTSHGIHSVHYDYHNEEDPHILLTLIKNSFVKSDSAPRAVFVRFMDEGHSPRPNTNSSLLSSLLTEFFLKNFLKA